MRKIKRCKSCDAQTDVQIKCDTCGKILSYPIILLTIEDTDYDFCELKCLLKFVFAEEAKENPRNDIITGETK